MNMLTQSSQYNSNSPVPAFSFDGGVFFKAADNEMMPTISRNEYLEIKPCNRYHGSGIYLVQIDGATHIRRLDRHPKGICVIADNENYTTEVMPEHSFKVLAKAVRVLKNVIV